MIASLTRGLEQVVCGLFKTPTITDLPRQGHGLSATQIDAALRRAKYYAIGNAVRAAFLVPPGLMLGKGPLWSYILTLLFLAFHLLVAIAEFIRANFLTSLDPESSEGFVQAPMVAPRIGVWFRPASWETERFYRLIGIEAFRKLVIRYENLTHGGSVARLTKSALLRFAGETCQAEVAHTLAFGMDLPPMIGLYAIRSTLVVFPVSMALIDVLLVLLQRAHRARLKHILP